MTCHLKRCPKSSFFSLRTTFKGTHEPNLSRGSRLIMAAEGATHGVAWRRTLPNQIEAVASSAKHSTVRSPAPLCARLQDSRAACLEGCSERSSLVQCEHAARLQASVCGVV